MSVCVCVCLFFFFFFFFFFFAVLLISLFQIHALDKTSLERLFFSRPEFAGGFYKALAENIEARLSSRNARVLTKYAQLLQQKVNYVNIFIVACAEYSFFLSFFFSFKMEILWEIS